MTICKVISTLPVGVNTAVIVDGSGYLFQNGIGVLDENGKPFEVLSVGMDNLVNPEDMLNKTSLLISGCFSSTRMYV